MITVENVSINVTRESGYTGRHTEEDASEPLFSLSVSVKSNSREFLERVAQAVHSKLAAPAAQEVSK
jgi:hypothetical protein